MKKNYSIMVQPLKMKKTLSFLALAFMVSINLNAQNATTWSGANTNFLDTSNWTGGSIPNGSSDVTIVATSNNPIYNANLVTVDAANTGNYISHLNGASGNPLTVSASLQIWSSSGNYAGGDFNIETGGSMNFRNSLYLGIANNPSVVNVNGGVFNVKSFLLISQQQAGTLNVNGGSLTTDSTGSIAVGNYPQYAGCNGILNVNAGLVKTAGALTIGSKGIVNVDAGRIELNTDRTLAMATYITNNVLKVSGAALTAGKILLNKYDPVTLLTTIMAVLPGTEPSALDYTTAAGSYTVGTAIADNPKSALTLGTGTAATYTVSPALPAGLTLDSATGTISGTPTATKALTTYYVKASTDYGFTTKAITIVVAAAPLGVNDFKESAKIAVYPNPTTDFVTVSLSNAAAIQKISVFNTLGQLVSSSVAKNTVSLQNLANGNYYLTIYTAEGNYSKKIIKQ